MPRRLHRDRELREILDSWNLLYPHPAAAAVRRLFANRAELDEFFHLAFPDYMPRPDLGALIERGGRRDVSYLRVLEAMEALNVQREDFEAMAFLAGDDGGQHQRMSPFFLEATPVVYQEDVANHRKFLDHLRVFSVDDLRTAFRYLSWKEQGAIEWVAGCLSHQIPAEYLNSILSDEQNWAYGWVYQDSWPPESMSRYYREGASAEYITRFWERADEFEELWSRGVPFEYAMALRDVD